MGLALLVSTKQVLQGKARNSLRLSFPFPVQELEGGTDKKLPLIAFEATYPSLYFACSPLAMHRETLTMNTHPRARREQPLLPQSRRKGGRTGTCPGGEGREAGRGRAGPALLPCFPLLSPSYDPSESLLFSASQGRVGRCPGSGGGVFSVAVRQLFVSVG